MHESNIIQALIPMKEIHKWVNRPYLFELCSGINKCWITSPVGKKSQAEIFIKSQYICILLIVQRLYFNLDEEENKMNLLYIFCSPALTLLFRMNGKTCTFIVMILLPYINSDWEQLWSWTQINFPTAPNLCIYSSKLLL